MNGHPHKFIRRIAILLVALVLFPSAGCKAGEKETPSASALPVQEPAVTAVPVSSSAPEGDLVMFVNVGKADATVIRSSGNCYIVDTGTAESVTALFGALNYLGIESVKGVFITHSHSDHVGGLEALLTNYPVDTVYRAAISFPKGEKKNPADKAAEKAGKQTVLLSAGDTIGIGNGNLLSVLGPLEMNTADDNDNSLVLHLFMNGSRILLAGDMQFAEEDTLVRRYGNDLHTDILRVGNHGNPDATGPSFASAADPKIAVISTDRSVDTDSANSRVLALFPDREILITDESDMGYLFRFPSPGETEWHSVQTDPKLSLTIERIDKETQTAYIRNIGADADLSGCMLLSEKGNELFVFPEGAFLRSGESCSVSGENGNGDYRWIGEKKPWNVKKEDRAILFDSFGNLLHAVN